MQYKPVQALWLSSLKCFVERGLNDEGSYCIALEFQPGPTRAALMKANDPGTSLFVDWILYVHRVQRLFFCIYLQGPVHAF